MASSSGRTYRIFISSDGTSTGTKQELALNGEITINLGKTTNRDVMRNGVRSFITDEGMSVSSEFLVEKPLGVAQAALQAAHEGETNVYAWVEDTETDGQSYAGEWLVALETLSAPTEGNARMSFQLSANGTITRSTIPA